MEDQPNKLQQLTTAIEKHRQNDEIIKKISVGNAASYNDMLIEANVRATTDAFTEIFKQ
jgi:hypothetical protein